MTATPAPRRAAGRRALCALGTLALALSAGAAHAGSYAALDEAPAGGGELRLATPGTHVDPEGRPIIGFPLQATFVDVRIEGPMAQVTVEQTFENPFSGPLEAVYVFPMDDDAAVHAYSFRIGEREVVGEIEERDAARRRYEDARDAGQTAGLLEQAKPNVFVQSLANIAPGEAITVRFQYVVLLDYRHESGYGFHFPMTISPRYVSPDALTPNTVGGGGGAPGAVTVPYADEGLAEVEIVVRADAGVPLRGVESSSHAIDVEADDTRARVTLSEVTTAPDRDFVLNLRTAGDRTLLPVAHGPGPPGLRGDLRARPLHRPHAGDPRAAGGRRSPASDPRGGSLPRGLGRQVQRRPPRGRGGRGRVAGVHRRRRAVRP